MSLPEPLQNFWDDQSAIISGLYGRGEVSLAQSLQNVFAKSLILTAASFFETEIKDVVIRTISHRSRNDSCVLSFCLRRGIERQFHTWFDWERSNANSFFAMFGDDLKKSSTEAISNEEGLEQSIKDYMFIGRKRNELVHQNFLTYPFDETVQQTRTRIESAVSFVRFAERLLIPLD